MTDEYAPTVEEVRRQWNNAVRSDLVPARSAEFDRMIAQVERAAAVKALREAATAIEHDNLYSDDRDGWAVDLVAGRAIELESGEQA